MTDPTPQPANGPATAAPLTAEAEQNLRNLADSSLYYYTSTIPSLRSLLASLDEARKERIECEERLRLNAGTIYSLGCENADLLEEIRNVKFVVAVTVGGMVEGQPTHSGNYLQRLRELVAKESAAMSQGGSQ